MLKHYFSSIRNQIITLILLMTLFPMSVIIYIAVQQEQHDIDEAIEMTAGVAKQIQHDQKILLNSTEQLAATVSILPDVKRHNTAVVNSILTGLIKNNPHISNIILIDRMGNLWASAKPAQRPLTFTDRRYFRNAVATGNISSGEYTIGKISQTPSFSFAYPFKDSSGNVTDVMGVIFSLDRYRSFYNRDTTSPVSSILLTDHKGTILYSSVNSALAGRQDRPDLFQRMESGPDEGAFEGKGNLGVNRVFSYRKLWLKGEPDPYMYIRTGLDKDYVQAKARNDLIVGAGVLVPVTLLMLGMAVFFCKRNILNKVSALQQTTQKIALGDLSARVPEYVSGGELGELATSFNDMAQQMELSDEAQRESEKKYRELVENANSIILKWDNHGTVIFFNEFAERFFGFSAHEIIGCNLVGTIVPETETSGRDLVELIRNICSSPGLYINNENENIRKNGERVWISWNNHALVAADGSKAGILSVGQDITERKRIEKELQLSEQRFRSFVENANDVIFALTPEGIFSYVSPNWKEAFGHELAETVGQPFAPFVHADDVPVCHEFMQRVFETGQKQSGVEYRVLCKNGRFLWYKANASLITDPTSGAVTLVGIGRDITERKNSEAILRQSEEKFSTVFHASPDAIILSRFQDGMMLDVNEGFTRITGFSADEVVGKTSLEIGLWSDPGDRAKLESVINKYGEIRIFEAYFTIKNGTKMLGQISARTIEIDDIPCLLSIIRDITEREFILSERIKSQKLEAISVLAGGIAHNFNNVLTGVIGYISYAQKHLDDPDKISQILKSAEKSSYRAAGLARQLLTFSQDGSTVQETVSVDTLVEESVSLFLSGSNVKGTIECTSHQTVRVDSQQINQAFNNIVLNALHAMPDGGTLKVLVDCITLDENNRYLLPPGNFARIVFEDSGCGIAKEALDKVFDPYFTTKDSGTGLGLSTTHSIITKHGGHIDVASEEGSGTTVTVMLPSSPEKSATLENTGEQTVSQHSAHSVLVMDDEKMIRDLAEELLNEQGYKAVTCASGEEAYTLYRDFKEAGSPFSLAILDLSIPDGMGGVETAQKILELDPQACLIATSGHSHDPALVNHAEFGFRGSIAKPYSNDELTRQITRALQKHPS